jgi:hypothetical protein
VLAVGGISKRRGFGMAGLCPASSAAIPIFYIIEFR